MDIRIERTENKTPDRGWDWRAYDIDTLDLGSIQGLGTDPEDALRDLEIRLEERGKR